MVNTTVRVLKKEISVGGKILKREASVSLSVVDYDDSDDDDSDSSSSVDIEN